MSACNMRANACLGGDMWVGVDACVCVCVCVRACSGGRWECGCVWVRG